MNLHWSQLNFLRKSFHHLLCSYSRQYMDVTRRAMAHFQVPALPNPLWWEVDTSDGGDYRHLLHLSPFFLRQFYGYQLLERSGMDTTETLNGRWISPPLKKGGVIRLLAVQPCEIQLTFQFRVFGCDSMQSFLDRLLVAVFHFLPAFSWVKHC